MFIKSAGRYGYGIIDSDGNEMNNVHDADLIPATLEAQAAVLAQERNVRVKGVVWRF